MAEAGYGEVTQDDKLWAASLMAHLGRRPDRPSDGRQEVSPLHPL